VLDGRSDKIGSISLVPLEQARPNGATPDDMENRSPARMGTNSKESFDHLGYQLETFPEAIRLDREKRWLGDPTAVDDSFSRPFSVPRELQTTLKEVKALECTRNLGNTGQEVRKHPESEQSIIDESLLSAPDPKRDTNIDLNLTYGLPLNSPKLLGKGFMSPAYLASENTRSRGADTDQEANSRRIKDIAEEDFARLQTSSGLNLRKPRSAKKEWQDHLSHPKGRNSQRRVHREPMATFLNVRGKPKVASKSDSSDRQEYEAENLDDGQMSTLTPLRLLQTAQLLKQWVSDKGNGQILAIQQRLPYLKHRNLVVDAPTTLVVLLVLHTTNPTLRCLILFMTMLVYIFYPSKSEKSS
jgi:hypothetical protein